MEVVRFESLKNGKRKIIFDTGESCVLYAKEAAGCKLKEQAVIEEESWQEICLDILLPRAKKRLLYLLERMDRTEHQLRQKLKTDGYPEEVQEEAIRYVASYHYIDDMRYACAYIRTHQNAKSRLQMKQALMQKGVSREIIDQAMEEACTGDSIELIQKFLEKKHYDPLDPDRARKQKVFQSLMRKGFPADEIRRAMELRETE